MNLYRNESSDPKRNAQRNLQGRTHYVDDDTLRFHKARIQQADDAAGGLLFWLIESVATEPTGHKREFRYAVFDVFGEILERPDLGQGFSTSKKAYEALLDKLAAIDALGITLSAISRTEHYGQGRFEIVRRNNP